MYPPEYESVNLIYVGEGYASGPIGYVANFCKEKGSFEGGFSLSNKGVGELVGGLGGATGLKPVVIDGKVQIYDYASQKWTTDYSLFAEKNVNYIIYDVKESEVEGGKNYYIWNARENALFGPYEWNFDAYTPTGFNTPSLLEVICGATPYIAFHGIFSSYSKEGNWTVHSNDVKDSTQGYSKVEILDPNTAAAHYFDGSFDVLDQNCKVLYTSTRDNDKLWITNASGVVKGKTLVKKNGIWYLMSV